MQNKIQSNGYRIGAISKRIGLSVDTLRYYEKIGLLPRVHRTASGIRSYCDKDISRLKFIQRSQKMDFTLAEIGKLLQMREDPQHARREVHELTIKKLVEIESYLQDLSKLRDELRQLTKLCASSEKGCPIIEDIESGKLNRSQ